jgi:hypothetical protein
LDDQNSPPCRTWEGIDLQTKKLWETGKKGVKSHFDDETKLTGIRDSVNRRFVALMQQKGNAAAKEEVNELARTDRGRLFNPFLRLLGIIQCLEYHSSVHQVANRTSKLLNANH